VRVQLHAVAVVLLSLNEQVTGWVVQRVWLFVEEERLFLLPGIGHCVFGCPASSLITVLTELSQLLNRLKVPDEPIRHIYA
jgi:hypothetical protein